MQATRGVAEAFIRCARATNEERILAMLGTRASDARGFAWMRLALAAGISMLAYVEAGCGPVIQRSAQSVTEPAEGRGTLCRLAERSEASPATVRGFGFYAVPDICPGQMPWSAQLVGHTK